MEFREHLVSHGLETSDGEPRQERNLGLHRSGCHLAPFRNDLATASFLIVPESVSTWMRDIHWGILRMLGAIYARRKVYQRGCGISTLVRAGSAPREVVADMRHQFPYPAERVELILAILVMADIDPWEHHLRKELGNH